MRLYHNNKKVIETEKAGRKGQKFIAEVEAYLNKVLAESSRWNYKTVANF